MPDLRLLSFMLAFALSCGAQPSVKQTDRRMSTLEGQLASGDGSAEVCAEYVGLCEQALSLCLERENAQTYPAFCAGLVSRCRTTVDQSCRSPVNVDGGADAGPIISTVQAIEVLERSAVITWLLNEPATGQVDFGTTTSYGRVSVPERSFAYSTHHQPLPGLNPGTLYHFRVRSSNRLGAESTSGDYTFRTDGGISQADGGPAISAVAAVEITQTSAIISWTLNEPATGQVEYGVTLAYGQLSKPELSFAYSSHYQPLSKLDAGTLYHFRVRSRNQASVESVSADYTFSTW